jgi:hypothetical protein
MSAIDADWLEKDVSGKLRGERTQSTYVKLFYARYFHVSGDQLATALGDSLRSREQADEHATYKKAAERLDNVWKTMRVRTFGKESYLNALVRHTVELHDFMVITSNLARLERIENATVTGKLVIHALRTFVDPFKVKVKMSGLPDEPAGTSTRRPKRTTSHGWRTRGRLKSHVPSESWTRS